MTIGVAINELLLVIASGISRKFLMQVVVHRRWQNMETGSHTSTLLVQTYFAAIITKSSTWIQCYASWGRQLKLFSWFWILCCGKTILSYTTSLAVWKKPLSIVCCLIRLLYVFIFMLADHWQRALEWHHTGTNASECMNSLVILLESDVFCEDYSEEIASGLSWRHNGRPRSRFLQKICGSFDFSRLFICPKALPLLNFILTFKEMYLRTRRSPLDFRSHPDLPWWR